MKKALFIIITTVVSGLIITLSLYGITSYKDNEVNKVKKEIVDSLQNVNINYLSKKLVEQDSSYCEKNTITNFRITQFSDKVIPDLKDIKLAVQMLVNDNQKVKKKLDELSDYNNNQLISKD